MNVDSFFRQSESESNKYVIEVRKSAIHFVGGYSVFRKKLGRIVFALKTFSSTQGKSYAHAHIICHSLKQMLSCITTDQYAFIIAVE